MAAGGVVEAVGDVYKEISAISRLGEISFGIGRCQENAKRIFSTAFHPHEP
jgi:hypothetical protein